MPPQQARPVRRDVALQALAEAASEHGQKMPGTSTIPAGVPVVTLDQWKARWILRTGYEDDDSGRVNFSKDRRALLAAGQIAISKPYVWSTV